MIIMPLRLFGSTSNSSTSCRGTRGRGIITGRQDAEHGPGRWRRQQPRPIRAVLLLQPPPPPPTAITATTTRHRKRRRQSSSCGLFLGQAVVVVVLVLMTTAAAMIATFFSGSTTSEQARLPSATTNKEETTTTASSSSPSPAPPPPPGVVVLRNFPAKVTTTTTTTQRYGDGVTREAAAIQHYRDRFTSWWRRHHEEHAGSSSLSSSCQQQQRSTPIKLWLDRANTNVTQQQQHTATTVVQPEECGIRPLSSSSSSSSLEASSSPSPGFTYPLDAAAHFVDVHVTLAAWGQHHQHVIHTAANYSGPWLENVWIDHFLALALAHNDENEPNNNNNIIHEVSSPPVPGCLADTFGEYIPLFIPWVDIWVQNKFRYPDGFVETLRRVLRPNVAYVTVSQSDVGLTGYRELPHHTIPNILVLSAGGYGHVPVPLLKQPEELVTTLSHPSDRPYTVAYVGSLDHSPKNMRRTMHETMVQLSSSSSSSNNTISYVHYYGTVDWRRVMTTARFNLVPRGYGRTAYHLLEVWQMGLIPIYIYSDEPWVPYRDLWWFFDNENNGNAASSTTMIGYATTVAKLPALLERLQQLSPATILQTEATIAALRHSHFTYAAVLRQIEWFLRPTSIQPAGRLVSSSSSSSSDLRCQPLPKRPR